MKSWKHIVREVLSDSDSAGMEERKLIKKAVKAARNEDPSLPKSELTANLQTFLAKGKYYKVHEGRVVKQPKDKKKRKHQDGNENNNAQTAQDDDVAPQQQATEQQEQNTEQQKKKKKNKRAAEHFGPKLAIQVAAENAAEQGPEPSTWVASQQRLDVKSGKFGKKELEILKEAIVQYANENDLSTTDYSWLPAGRGKRQVENKKTLGVWKHVARYLPHRNIKAVAMAGTRLLHPHARKGPWTEEEDERLLKYAVKYSKQWARVGKKIGRTNDSCKDRYRTLKSVEPSKRLRGPWSEEEKTKLQAAVEEYMQAKKAAEEEILAEGGSITPSFRRNVMDDIDWGIVSKKVGTRNHSQCCSAWYNNVCPSMIAKGDWGEGDDNRMLRRLWKLQADYEYEVPWDQLITGRTAMQTRRRWKLMQKSVENFHDMIFPEILDALVTKYMPRLKESRDQS